MARNSNQRSAAFEAYVLRGRDLEAISDETGIPLGTLKRWAADGRESPDQRSWHAMRLANYRDRSAITANFFSLAAKKISDATAPGATAQDQYAAINFFKALAGEKSNASPPTATTESKSGADTTADNFLAAMGDVPELAKALKSQRVRTAFADAIRKRQQPTEMVA